MGGGSERKGLGSLGSSVWYNILYIHPLNACQTHGAVRAVKSPRASESMPRPARACVYMCGHIWAVQCYRKGLDQGHKKESRC
jgi:hypothetical protein